MSAETVKPPPSRGSWLWAAIPLALLGGLIWLFLATDPLGPLGASAPPIEQLTVERTVLGGDGIELFVRADGSEPLTLAQVQVDGAYWEFTQDPPGPLGRLETARLAIPYPWVKDELHELTLLTRTGVTFGHTIEVAEPTPQPTLARALAFALLGLYVGVVPVTLGLLFYPFLRTLGARGLQFLLALTVGLLALALAGVGAQDEHVQRAVPGRLLERPHVHRLPVVVEGAPERARVPGAQAEQRREQDGEQADDPRPAPAAPRDRRGVVARGLGARQGLGRPGRGRGMAHSGLLLGVGGQASLRTPRQASAATARRRRGLGWQRGHRWLARFMNGSRTMRESIPSAAQRRHGCPVRP